MTKTEINLDKAITGEAKARLEYMAFAMQAMQEGYPQIAQLFMEVKLERLYPVKARSSD